MFSSGGALRIAGHPPRPAEGATAMKEADGPCVISTDFSTDPVSAVGPSLSSWGLSRLQPSVGKRVLVKAIGAEGAGSTALVEVSTRFSPGGDKVMLYHTVTHTSR